MSFCIGLILRSGKIALAALWAKKIALVGRSPMSPFSMPLSFREPSYQTNAGLAYELLTSWLAQNIFLQYQPGLQFERHNLLASG